VHYWGGGFIQPVVGVKNEHTLRPLDFYQYQQLMGAGECVKGVSVCVGACKWVWVWAGVWVWGMDLTMKPGQEPHVRPQLVEERRPRGQRDTGAGTAETIHHSRLNPQ